MSKSVNQKYFDMQLAHDIEVKYYTNNEIAKVLDLLERNDRDVTKKLRAFVNKNPKLSNFKDARYKELLKEIYSLRKAGYKKLREQVTPELVAFAKDESAAQLSMMQEATPITLDLNSVPLSVLRGVVTAQPFQGQLLSQWYKTLQDNDQAALLRAIQQGYSQGESIDQIVARVAGTKATGYTDGALALSRRRARDVVRTAVSSVANHTRAITFEANSDVLRGMMWVSTLDGRTTPICIARDNRIALFPGKELMPGEKLLKPPTARPPAHFNCRSLMVGILDGYGILGSRPTVRDTRLPSDRKLDFAAEAKSRGVSVAQVRTEWVNANIGSVTAKTSYENWLKVQPKSFQIRVLGRTRYELFTEGNVRLDQFVDYTGRQITLAQLRKTVPGAFSKIE